MQAPLTRLREDTELYILTQTLAPYAPVFPQYLQNRLGDAACEREARQKQLSDPDNSQSHTNYAKKTYSAFHPQFDESFPLSTELSRELFIKIVTDHEKKKEMRDKISKAGGVKAIVARMQEAQRKLAETSALNFGEHKGNAASAAADKNTLHKATVDFVDLISKLDSIEQDARTRPTQTFNGIINHQTNAMVRMGGLATDGVAPPIGSKFSAVSAVAAADNNNTKLTQNNINAAQNNIRESSQESPTATDVARRSQSSPAADRPGSGGGKLSRPSSGRSIHSKKSAAAGPTDDGKSNVSSASSSIPSQFSNNVRTARQVAGAVHRLKMLAKRHTSGSDGATNGEIAVAAEQQPEAGMPVGAMEGEGLALRRRWGGGQSETPSAGRASSSPPRLLPVNDANNGATLSTSNSFSPSPKALVGSNSIANFSVANPDGPAEQQNSSPVTLHRGNTTVDSANLRSLVNAFESDSNGLRRLMTGFANTKPQATERPPILNNNLRAAVAPTLPEGSPLTTTALLSEDNKVFSPNEADGATSASRDNGINEQREYTDVYEDENGDIISMDTLYLPSMHIDLITLYEALKKVKEDREDVFDLVKQYKYGMIEYVPITEENVDAMSEGDDGEGDDEDYSDDEQDPFGEDDDGEEDVDGDGDVDDDDDMSKLRSVPTVAMGLRHAMSVYDLGGGKPKKSKQALRKLKQEKERRNRRKKAARTDEERKQQLEEMRATFTFADLAVFYDELPAWAKGVSVQIGDTEKAKVAQIFTEQIDLRQGELKQLQQLQSERDQSAVLSGAEGEGEATAEKNVPPGDNVHVSEAQPTNTLPKLTVTTAAAPKATMTRKDFAVRLLESLDLKYYQGLRYMGGSATAYADALYGKEKTKENDDDDEFDDSDDEDFLASEREKEERNILQRDGLLLAIENYNGFGGRQTTGDGLLAKPAVGSLEATAANLLASASLNLTSADGEGPITTTAPTAAPAPPPPMDFATALAKQQIILREREILKQLIKRHWVVDAWVEDELYDEEDYYEIDGGEQEKEVEGVGRANAADPTTTADNDATTAAVPASPARSANNSGPNAPMATDSVAKLLKDSDRVEDSTGTSPTKVTASVRNLEGAQEGDDSLQPTSTPRVFTDGLLPTKDVRRKSNATDVGSVVSTAASAKLRRQERERRRQEYIKKLQVPISRAAFMRAFDEEKALADASMDPLNLTMTLFPDAEMDCEVLLKLLEMLKVRAVMKISTFDLAARKARQFQDLNDLIVFVPLLIFFIIISFAGRGLSEGSFDGYGIVKALQKITTERVTYYSSCSLSAVENSTTNEVAFACDEESNTMTLGDIGAPDDIYSFLGSFVPNLLWPKQVDKGTIDENGNLVNDTTTQSTKRVTAGNTKVASTLTPVGGLRIRQQRVKAEDFDDPSSASFFALQRLLLPTSSVFSKDGGPTIGSVTEAGGLSAYSFLSSWLSPSASGRPSIIEPNVEAAYSIKLTPPKKYPTLSHSTKDTHGHTEFLDGLLSQGLTFTGNTTAGVADSGITNQLQALHALLSPSTSSVDYFSNSTSVSSSDLLTSWTDGDGRVNDGTHYKTCSALSSYVTQRGMGRDYDCGGFAIDIPFRLNREEYLEVVGIIAGATNPITVPNSSPSPSAAPAPVPWLNLATRAVMVEYFLFHQNSGMLVMAKHLFEVHAGGGVTHTLSVVPFFLPVRTSYNSFIVASYYLFMAFLILYGLRLVTRAARAFFEFCVESRERYKLFTKAFDRKRRKDLREAETMAKVRRRHRQMARAHRAKKFDSSATAGNAAEAMAALQDDDSNDDDDAAAAASPVYNSPMDVIPATAISRHTNRQRNFATVGPGGLPPALTKRRNKGSSRVSSPWSSFVLTLRFSNSSKRWIKVLLEFTNLAIFVVGIVTYRGGGVSFEEEGSPGGGSSTFVDPVWQLDHYPRGYEKIQYEYDIAMILNAANIVLSVLIFLGFTQYMPRFSTVVGTIGRSIRPALALGFAAAMMLVGFAICATMAIGDSIEGYHTIGKSIVTLLSAFWDGWDYAEMNSTNQNNLYYFTYIYILFYVVVFIVFVLGSVLAVFADAFSDEVEAQFDPKDLRAIVSSDMFCTLRSGRRRGRRGGGGSTEDAIDASLQQIASHRAMTAKEDQGSQGKRSTRSAHHGGGQGLWQYMFLECDYYLAGSLTYAEGFFVSKVYHVRIFLATSRILNYICCCCLCAFPKRWLRRQPNIHEKTDQYGRNKVALFTTPSDKHRYNAFDYFAVLERDLFDIRGASEEAKPNMPKACRAAARLIRLVRSELVIPPAPEPFRFSAPVFDVPTAPEGTNNNSGSSFTSRSSSISYSSTVQNTYANNYNFHFGGGGGATSRPGSAALSTISGYSSTFAGAGSTIQGPQGTSSSLLSPPPPSWFSRRKCVYDFVFNSIFGKERVDYTLTLMFYVLIPQNMFGEDGVNALEEAANARAQWDSLAAQVTIEADEGEVAEMQKHVSNLLLITAGTDPEAVVPSELPIGTEAIAELADPSQGDGASAVQVPSTTDLRPNVSDSNMNGSRLLSPAEGSDEADKKETSNEGGEEEADKRSMAERSLEEMTRVNRRLFLGILALAHHSALAPPRMERVHVIAPISGDEAHAGDHPDHSTTHNAESHLHNSQSIHRQTSDVHSGAKPGHHRRRRHQDHADFAPPPLTYAYYGTLNETLFLSIVEDLRAKKSLPAYFDGVDFWHRNGLGGMIAAPGLHTKAFPPPPTTQQRKQWKVHHHHASMLRQGSVKLHNNTSSGNVKKQVSILKSGSSAYSENLSDMLYNHPHALNNPYLDPSAPQEPTCPLPPAHATLRYTHDPSFFRSRDRIIMSDFIPLIQNEYVIQSIGLKFQLDESLAFAVAAKRIVNQRIAKEYKTHTKKLQLQQKATQSAMKVSKFGGSDTSSAAPPSTTSSSYHSHYVPSFESFDSKRDTSDDKYLSVDEFSRAWCAAKGSFPSSKIINHISTFFKIGVQPLPAPPQPTQLAQQEPSSSAPISPLSAQQLASASLMPIVDDPTTRIPTKIDWHLFTHACQADPQALSRQSFEHSLSLLLKRNWENNLWHGAFFFLLAFYSAFIIMQCGGEAIHVTDSLKGTFAPSSDTPPQSSIDYTPDDDTDDSYVYHDVSDWVRQTVKSVWSEQSELELTVTKRGLFNTSADETTSTASIPFLSHHKSNFFVGAIRVMQWRVRPSSPRTCDSLYETYFGSANVKYESYTHSVDYTSYFNRQLSGPVNAAFEAWQKASPRTSAEIAARKALLESEQQLEAAYYRERVTSDFPLIAERYCVGPWGERGKREATRFGNGMWPGGLSNDTAEAEYYNFDNLSDEARNAFLFREFSDEISEERRVLKNTDPKASSAKRAFSPSTFTTGLQRIEPDTLGNDGTYPSDGFYFDIPISATADQADQLVDSVLLNNWIDRQTRLVMVRMVLYNPNLNLVTAGRFGFEMPSSGNTIAIAHVNSVSLSSSPIPFDNVFLPLCVILWIIVAFYWALVTASLFASRHANNRFGSTELIYGRMRTILPATFLNIDEQLVLNLSMLTLTLTLAWHTIMWSMYSDEVGGKYRSYLYERDAGYTGTLFHTNYTTSSIAFSTAPNTTELNNANDFLFSGFFNASDSFNSNQRSSPFNPYHLSLANNNKFPVALERRSQYNSIIRSIEGFNYMVIVTTCMLFVSSRLRLDLLLKTITIASKDLISIAVLYIIVVIAFTVGMQQLWGYDSSSVYSFGSAFLSMFVGASTGGSLPDGTADTTRSVAGPIYQMAFLLIANSVLFNMVTAILTGTLAVVKESLYDPSLVASCLETYGCFDDESETAIVTPAPTGSGQVSSGSNQARGNGRDGNNSAVVSSMLLKMGDTKTRGKEGGDAKNNAPAKKNSEPSKFLYFLRYIRYGIQRGLQILPTYIIKHTVLGFYTQWMLNKFSRSRKEAGEDSMVANYTVDTATTVGGTSANHSPSVLNINQKKSAEGVPSPFSPTTKHPNPLDADHHEVTVAPTPTKSRGGGANRTAQTSDVIASSSPSSVAVLFRLSFRMFWIYLEHWYALVDGGTPLEAVRGASNLVSIMAFMDAEERLESQERMVEELSELKQQLQRQKQNTSNPSRVDTKAEKKAGVLIPQSSAAWLWGGANDSDTDDEAVEMAHVLHSEEYADEEERKEQDNLRVGNAAFAAQTLRRNTVGGAVVGQSQEHRQATNDEPPAGGVNADLNDNNAASPMSAFIRSNPRHRLFAYGQYRRLPIWDEFVFTNFKTQLSEFQNLFIRAPAFFFGESEASQWMVTFEERHYYNSMQEAFQYQGEDGEEDEGGDEGGSGGDDGGDDSSANASSYSSGMSGDNISNIRFLSSFGPSSNAPSRANSTMSTISAFLLGGGRGPEQDSDSEVEEGDDFFSGKLHSNSGSPLMNPSSGMYGSGGNYDPAPAATAAAGAQASPEQSIEMQRIRLQVDGKDNDDAFGDNMQVVESAAFELAEVAPGPMGPASMMMPPPPNAQAQAQQVDTNLRVTKVKFHSSVVDNEGKAKPISIKQKQLDEKKKQMEAEGAKVGVTGDNTAAARSAAAGMFQEADLPQQPESKIETNHDAYSYKEPQPEDNAPPSASESAPGSTDPAIAALMKKLPPEPQGELADFDAFDLDNYTYTYKGVTFAGRSEREFSLMVARVESEKKKDKAARDKIIKERATILKKIDKLKKKKDNSDDNDD